jgi:hypothetical protein
VFFRRIETTPEQGDCFAFGFDTLLKTSNYSTDGSQ